MNKKIVLLNVLICLLLLVSSCEDEVRKKKTDVKVSEIKQNKIRDSLVERKLSDSPVNYGVTGNEVLIGSTSALTGEASFLGRQTNNGALCYIKYVNENGGIHGRKIKLIGYDDAYDSIRCIFNTIKLVDEERVFCLFNYVGTPTSIRIISFVEKNKVPVIGLFTGAEALRAPFKKYIFNIRASYYQETDAMIHYFVNKLRLKKIAVFYQNDAYGMAGLEGAERALKKYNLSPVSLGTYIRGTEDISDGLNRILKSKPEAIVMIGYYGPCAKFILEAKKNMPNLYFHNLSFVGPDILLKLLRGKTERVYVTQVIPPPTAVNIPIVKKYNELLAKYFPLDMPNFVSLEGFINALVLVKALEGAGKSLTRAELIRSLENMHNQDLGGIKINYNYQDHQGMKEVYITLARKDKYEIVKE